MGEQIWEEEAGGIHLVLPLGCAAAGRSEKSLYCV